MRQAVAGAGTPLSCRVLFTTWGFMGDGIGRHCGGARGGGGQYYDDEESLYRGNESGAADIGVCAG